MRGALRWIASKTGANSCFFHNTTPAATMIFGIVDVLRRQALQQPARDERVIPWRAQALSDGAEGLEECVEIGVPVERAELFQRRGGVELVQRFGLNGTFQVQM